ncbi:MAG: hypothetical protein GF313_04885 [Caldithrix sp.]|nr:hypothetical protein [Caldithrix sp.]
MLNTLLKQPLYAWKEQSLLFKIEMILLLIVLYAYFSERIIAAFNHYQMTSSISVYSMSNGVVHVFILLVMLSIPFILYYLIPKQRGIHIFCDKPLSNSQILQLIGYYVVKYLLIYWIILIPFFIALFVIDWGTAIFHVAAFAAYTLIIYLWALSGMRRRQKATYFAYAMAVILLFHSVYASVFILIQHLWILDVIVLFGSGLILWFLMRRPASLHLETLYPAALKRNGHRKSGWLSFQTIPAFLPAGLQVLFNKELIGLWRNAKYRRLKWITLAVYILLLVMVSLRADMANDIGLILISMAVIWLHYSHHFSEKYMHPDPDWFFHTLPLGMFRMMLSRFLVEYFYILLILLIAWIYMIGQQMGAQAQLQTLALLLIFATVILLIMVNFRVMFYDNPRTAGYAYHFTVIFLLVMSVNYRFVGPIISVVLLAFYFYKNYKYIHS